MLYNLITMYGDLNAVGLRIKLARIEKGLMQKDLANLLNFDRQVIIRMEAGRRRVDLKELNHIAKLLGKPLSFFLEEEKPESKPDKYIDVSGLDDKEIEIIKATIDKIREVKKERSA